MKHFYLTKDFARRLSRSGLGDDALAEALRRADKGKVDADLGAGLIKQRVGRKGAGRSAGFRTIIAYRRGERAIFLYLFAKSAKANVSPVEFKDLKDIAKLLAKLSDEQLRELAAERQWKEVERADDDEEKLS